MAMKEALQVLFTAEHELGVQPWQPLRTLTPPSRHHTKYGIWICVTALWTLQNAAICFHLKLQKRCCHLCGDRSCISCGRSKAFKSIELSFGNARRRPHMNCCVLNSYGHAFSDACRIPCRGKLHIFVTWMVANCWINWHLDAAQCMVPSGISHRLCRNKRAVRICVAGCFNRTTGDPSLVAVTLHSHIILQSITGNLSSSTM